MRKIKRRFTDFSLNSKLAILIGIFLVSLIGLGSVVHLLFSTSKVTTIISNLHRVFLDNFNESIEHYYSYKILGDSTQLEQSFEHLDKSIGIAYTFATFDQKITEVSAEEWDAQVYSQFSEGVNYDKRKVKLLRRIVRMLADLDSKILDDPQEVALEASEAGKKVKELMNRHLQLKDSESFAELQQEYIRIHTLSDTFAAQIYILSEFIFKRLVLFIILFVLALGIVSGLVSKRIASSISRPVKQLAENFKRIAKGDLKSSVRIDTQNEVGELSNAFMEIQVGLQDIIAYSQNVAQGDYSQKLIPKSPDDELTVALNRMAERLELTKIKNDKESWLQSGIGGLEDQMRGNYSVRELSSRIISYLCSFLEVEMGAVYVYDEVLEHLELTGSSGIIKEEVKEKLKPGEGLVGKAALEHKLLVLDTKDKYHRIFSASGELHPEKLYLLPMHYNQRIQAVIELASIRELPADKIDFLLLIADRISVNLGASVARFRHKELLDKSLEQAEILKARDEELIRKLEENRQIQQKLIQEKALLDSMLYTIPDFVYFKDENSKFLRVSESMVGLFGVSSSREIIGKSDFDFHPQADAKIYFDEEQQIIKNGTGFINIIRNGTDEDGKELWTSVTKLPLYDETGKCIGTFGISKNITQIKKLEIEVQQHNEKLIAQQEELKTTNEELKSQEEELRVANEELAEQTKVLTESQKNLQAQQEELRVINEELEVKSIELERQKKEISVKNENLIKTQNELRQKAKELEQASRYKSEFLANMSHELRTPLNSLLILSKLLANNKKGNLNEDQLKSVQIIHKSGKDLLDLINEILDLSKIEAGKMTYEFTEVSTEEVLTEIMHTFKPVAENKNLELGFDRTEGFPEIIYTDRQRLMQIIKNLLSNAFKFTTTGGIKVNFGVPRENTLFVNAELNNSNTCYISVEDTGVGIPKSKAEAIFEAFQQADGSISRKFGGTGLGLSISKQLVQILGGEIHVESTEGVGSVFTVYLPVDRTLVGRELNAAAVKTAVVAEALPHSEFIGDSFAPEEIKAVNPISQKENQRKQLLVLIIHDEPEKSGQLVSLCSKKKIDTLTAVSVEEGIKLAEIHAPGAIIVSATLPEEGFEKLKKNQTTCQLPLHLISRIDDSFNETIDELITPESEAFQVTAKTLEGKLKKEYKQVLVVEDDQNTRIAIQSLFENKEIVIHEAKTGQQAFDMIAEKRFDCVILDLGLPDFSGYQLLQKLNNAGISIPNLVIHTARDLSQAELRELQEYSDSIVIKGIKSDERLMDEVTLFLHQIENKVPKTDVKISNGKSVFKGKKVLVVDDDIRNVFALVQILEEREIEVLEAENGEVAIEVLKNNPDVDLVLMDIMMPVMDGYEAMNRIRQTESIQKIPIITLTAKAMKEDYRKAIECGANDYISKPVDLDKLLSLLKIWLFK